MKGETETLLNFQTFAAWRWETEFQQALTMHKPDASAEAVDRMRFGILSEFVEFVREIVSEEFGLGLLVETEGLTAEGVIGRVDFAGDRRTALARIEGSIAAWGPVPKTCLKGSILDRLLVCTEFVRAPDRLTFGEFKRECLTRFKNDGSIAHSVAAANSDGNHDNPFKAAPVKSASKPACDVENPDIPSLDDLTYDPF
jgi:hypothetical protein